MLKFMRCRLWHLLALTTLVACLAAWYSHASIQNKRQLAAIEALDETLYGYIHILRDDEQGPRCGTYLSGTARLKWGGPVGMPVAWRQTSWASVFYKADEVSIYGDGPFKESILKSLHNLRGLRRLEMFDWELSAHQVDEIEKLLPGTTIVIYQPSPEYSLGDDELPEGVVLHRDGESDDEQGIDSELTEQENPFDDSNPFGF